MTYPTRLADLAAGKTITLDEVNGEPKPNDDGEIVVIVWGEKEDSEWKIRGYSEGIHQPRNDVAKFWCKPIEGQKYRLSRGRPMDTSNRGDPFGEMVYYEENND